MALGQVAMWGWMSFVTTGPPVAVNWSAPDVCRPSEQVDQRILDSLGSRDIEGKVEVTVRGSSGAWKAEVEVITAEGTIHRTLGEAECGALGDAIAVVIAVALDPFGASRAAPAMVPPIERKPDPGVVPPTHASHAMVSNATDPSATESKATEPSPQATAQPPPRHDAVEWRGVGVSLGVGGEFGLLPSVLGTAFLGLVLDLGPVRIDLSGNFVGARRYSHAQGGGAWFNAATAQVRTCGVLRRPRVEFPLCIGGEAGVVTARGHDLARRGTARGTWVSVLGSVRMMGRLTARWWLFGDVQGIVSLVRPGFTIDDFESPLAAAKPGSVRFAIGVEVRFPNEKLRSRR